MPEYPPGTPSWVELDTADGGASANFYSQLFGWSVTDAEPVDGDRGLSNVPARRQDQSPG